MPSILVLVEFARSIQSACRCILSPGYSLDLLSVVRALDTLTMMKMMWRTKTMMMMALLLMARVNLAPIVGVSTGQLLTPCIPASDCTSSSELVGLPRCAAACQQRDHLYLRAGLATSGSLVIFVIPGTMASVYR